MIGIDSVISGLLCREIAIDCGPNISDNDISKLSSILEDELRGDVEIRNPQNDIKRYIMEHREAWPYLFVSNRGAENRQRFAMCNNYYLRDNNLTLISISDITDNAIEAYVCMYSFDSVFDGG